MLDIIVPDFAAHFIDPAANQDIDVCLDAERRGLMDPHHLVRQVVGDPGEFEWDFSCLEPGFMDLVHPFLHGKSGTSNLLVMTLHDLGAYEDRFLKATILVEYAHYASLINDYYNFHPVFTTREKDRRECAQLTQLRYAGQFLSNYPRYLVIQDHFGLEGEPLRAIHQWINNNYVSLGMSRGVFLKWAERDYGGVTLDNHYQNAINALNNYLHYPVVWAALLAQLPDAQVAVIKRALSYLAVALKLRLEATTLDSGWALPVNPYHAKSALPYVFPGYGLLSAGISPQAAWRDDLEYPDAEAYTKHAIDAVRNGSGSVGEGLRSEAARCHARFAETLDAEGLLPGLVAAFNQSFDA